MSQHRSETLVNILYGQLRMVLTPTIDKLLHTRQILAGLAIGLDGFPDNDELNRFTGNIGHKIVVQF